MSMWKYVPAGAVLTAMVFLPTGELPDVSTAVVPEMKPAPLARLSLERINPTFGLSRTPVSSYSATPKPLQGIRVLVDPGHGGQEKWDKILYCGGTVGVATGQTESDVNLRVALCLRQYLEAAGADVVMTRISDDRCTNCGDKRDELDFRSDLANSMRCDLFISVHHNESPKSHVNHTLVFYPQGRSDSVALADNVASAASRYIGTDNLGAKSGNYRILKGIRMPGVLVEASFMSNPSEDRRLANLAYNKLEAKAIATGVLNYVRMTRGRKVDFNTIFSPIDDKAGTAQSIADASFVRRQIVEKRSLFGVRYEEVTFDAYGRETGRRAVGRDSLAVSRDRIKKTGATIKSIASKVVPSKSSAKSSSSKKSSSKTSPSKKSSSKTSGKTKVVADKKSDPKPAKVLAASDRKKSAASKSTSVAAAKKSTDKPKTTTSDSKKTTAKKTTKKS